MKTWTTGVALCAWLLVCGCSDEQAPSCAEGPPAITAFSVTPTSVAPGDTLDATAKVSGFQLGGDEDAEDPHASSCVGGHIHVYLDDLMTNPLLMPETEAFQLTIPVDTPPGRHTLIARLQTHDHKILEPQVTAQTEILVEAP